MSKKFLFSEYTCYKVFKKIWTPRLKNVPFRICPCIRRQKNITIGPDSDQKHCMKKNVIVYRLDTQWCSSFIWWTALSSFSPSPSFSFSSGGRDWVSSFFCVYFLNRVSHTIFDLISRPPYLLLGK